MGISGTGEKQKPPHRQLEIDFADWNEVDANRMVGCSSGSAALHLALEVLKSRRSIVGYEVLVPEFTMIACARAVVLAGFTPVFVDCGNDLLMDPDHLFRQLNRCDFPAAVMPVHIYGRRCDMASIYQIASSRNLAVIEDCAEAHGVECHGPSFAYCWSFYKNKIVAGEEGGAVCFDDEESAELARNLRCQGFTERHDFMHIPRGMNYRLSDCHAELILKSLHNVEHNLKMRELIAQWYDEVTPETWRQPRRYVNWVYDLRIRGLNMGQLESIVGALRGKGVEARCGFKPMSIQPEFNHHGPVGTNALKASREVMYLPIGPEMTRADVEKNVSCLIEECNSL